jgi:hypothetical protein
VRALLSLRNPAFNDLGSDVVAGASADSWLNAGFAYIIV